MNKPDSQPKITIVPPNPAPKRLTVFSAIRSLRDHAMAFWNANNPKGIEPVEAPATTIATPVPKPKRKSLRPAAVPGAKAGINWAALAKVMVDNPVQAEQIRLTAAGTLLLKHIYGTRIMHSYRTLITESTPLCDSEYMARRKQLLASNPSFLIGE